MIDASPSLFALGAGLPVGVICGHVRSPAPTVLALVGRLGSLRREQVVPAKRIGKRIACRAPVTGALLGAACGAHVPGQPGATAEAPPGAEGERA